MTAASISSVTPTKARYLPGESVLFAIGVNATVSGAMATVHATVYQLDHVIATTASSPVIVEHPWDVASVELEWRPPRSDYQGYLVDLELRMNGKRQDRYVTAVDVSSDWTRFPRYGYLSDFSEKSPTEALNTVLELNKYHINGLQYYDWQYKHHRPIPYADDPYTNSWPDIANRTVYASTVSNLILFANGLRMMNMNYNLLFGAYADATNEGVDMAWSVYKNGEPDGHALPDTWATKKILLMDPANASWQDYILSEEERVFDRYAFDGWHIDQLGDRGDISRADGSPIDIAQAYDSFLLAAKDRLDTRLVMNAVGGYASETIARTPVDFLYTEAWPWIQRTYGDLQRTIEQGWRDSNHTKNTVLAAYMNYEASNLPGHFNRHAVLLTDATIFASGGAHLELGDTGMLSKEYFPHDNFKMSPALEAHLRRYYTFSVAYQNWLRDLDVRPIERSILASIPLSPSDEPGLVWFFVRRRGQDEVLHLINLKSQTSNEWRDDAAACPAPEILETFEVYYTTPTDCASVLLASPDIDGGQAMPLDFEKRATEEGFVISFTVPSLTYWDMIVFRGEDL